MNRGSIERACTLAVLSALGAISAVPAVHALTQEEIVHKLERAGYAQIREMPAGKIKSFRAVKDGRETSVLVDSTGHIKELQQ